MSGGAVVPEPDACLHCGHAPWEHEDEYDMPLDEGCWIDGCGCPFYEAA